MPALTSLSRTVLSTLLAVLSAVLLTLSFIRTWADDVLYDDDRFAGTAVRVFKRDDVRLEVRNLIVQQIIQQQPDLVSARPLIETVVDTAIRTKAFELIVAAAAEELHRLVFETDQRTLVLNITDIMTVAVAGIRAYDPELADRIPGGPEIGNIELTTRNTGTRAAEFDRQLEALRWIFIAGAAAALAGAIAIGHAVRNVLAIAGISLVACAIAVWFGVGVVAEIIRRQVGKDDVLGDAAAAAWEIYAEELTWWMWIQALAGVVMAVVASSAIATVPVGERLAGWRRWLEAAWSWRAARVLIAIAVMALGVGLLATPEPTLRLMAQAGGLTLVYLAGGELLRDLGLARERPAGEPARARRSWTELAPRLAAGAGVFAAVAIGAFTLWSNRDAFRADTVQAIPPIDRCNGLAQNCDRRLDEVMFAATHNSMAASEEPGWYLSEQLHPIRAQLNDGIRGLLIDVYYGYSTNRGVRTDPNTGHIVDRLDPWFDPAALLAAQNLANQFGPIPTGSKPALYLCHAYCELGATPFDRVMGELASFLKDNPHEVVMIILQDYVDPADVQASFERTHLIDQVYTLEPGEPLPTLRSMIEIDRRLLVFSENIDARPRPAWYHPAFEYIQDTPFGFRSVDEFTCGPNRGLPESPLLLANHWISSSRPSPRDAEVPNSADVLRGRIAQCENERGRRPNLIAVNFSETGDLVNVVREFNEQEEVPEGP